MIDLSIIDNILYLLDEIGLKQVDLCSCLNINTSTFTTWKNRGTDPPAKYILLICEFLGITPYELLGNSKMEPINQTEDEAKLLSYYRQLNDIEKGILIGEAKAYAEKSRK